MMFQRSISVQEAAKFLQVEQSAVYMALQKGQIPTSRRNGRTVISKGALLDYLARKKPML
jgi:excisionase family DNA binding protein